MSGVRIAFPVRFPRIDFYCQWARFFLLALIIFLTVYSHGYLRRLRSLRSPLPLPPLLLLLSFLSLRRCPSTLLALSLRPLLPAVFARHRPPQPLSARVRAVLSAAGGAVWTRALLARAVAARPAVAHGSELVLDRRVHLTGYRGGEQPPREYRGVPSPMDRNLSLIDGSIWQDTVGVSSIYTYLCRYTHIYTCIYIYKMCIQICICIYTCTYIHVYTVGCRGDANLYAVHLNPLDRIPRRCGYRVWVTVGRAQPPTCWIRGARKRIRYSIHIWLFYEYIHLEYVRIHVIYRVNQAEYVIHMLVVRHRNTWISIQHVGYAATWQDTLGRHVDIGEAQGGEY